MSYKSNLKLLVMLGPDLLTSFKNLEREDNKKKTISRLQG